MQHRLQLQRCDQVAEGGRQAARSQAASAATAAATAAETAAATAASAERSIAARGGADLLHLQAAVRLRLGGR